jgi:hypothetical protein
MAEPPTVLVVRARKAGFFSNLNRVVSHLAHSIGRDGVAAVVADWSVGPNLPFSAYGTPADGNRWARFFEPLPELATPGRRITVASFADRGITGVKAYRTYKQGPAWRHLYHAAFERHVRVRPHILERVERLHRELIGDRFCVGVHYRAPDHAIECPRPIPPVASFIRRARRLLPSDGAGTIFLATDVTDAAIRFRDAFGERCAMQPAVERLPAGARGHVHHNHPRPSVRLGEEVLIDALLLARCDRLLHVTSNLATAVGYINPAIEMTYCEGPIDRFLARFSSRLRAP